MREDREKYYYFIRSCEPAPWYKQTEEMARAESKQQQEPPAEEREEEAAEADASPHWRSTSTGGFELPPDLTSSRRRPTRPGRRTDWSW